MDTRDPDLDRRPHPHTNNTTKHQCRQDPRARLVPRRDMHPTQWIMRLPRPRSHVTHTRPSCSRFYRSARLPQLHQRSHNRLQGTQLLPHALRPIPALLIPPHSAHRAACAARTTLGCCGCGRAEEGDYLGSGPGRHGGGGGEPAGQEGFEGALVRVAVCGWLAAGFGHYGGVFVVEVAEGVEKGERAVSPDVVLCLRWFVVRVCG